MLEQFNINLKSSGYEKPVEFSTTVNVSDLQSKESELGLQIIAGEKVNDTLQELGILHGRPALVIKIKSKDPYSGANKLQEIVDTVKEVI